MALDSDVRSILSIPRLLSYPHKHAEIISEYSDEWYEKLTMFTLIRNKILIFFLYSLDNGQQHWLA